MKNFPMVISFGNISGIERGLALPFARPPHVHQQQACAAEDGAVGYIERREKVGLAGVKLQKICYSSAHDAVVKISGSATQNQAQRSPHHPAMQTAGPGF